MSYQGSPLLPNNDSSICLGQDASMLSVPLGRSGERGNNHLQLTGQYTSLLPTYEEVMTEGAKGGSDARQFGLEGEEDEDEADWVLCPDKDEVPDADYAPHLRVRRPKKKETQFAGKKSARKVEYEKGETNHDPPVTAVADVVLAVAIGILCALFS